MSFDPVNRLEEIMVQAVHDENARPHFYQALLETELYVLGEAGTTPEGAAPATLLETDTLNIETVTYQEQAYHPVFSSLERMRHFVPQPMPYFSMQGRALFECTRGASFLLNPGPELGKKLVPEEIALCLDQRKPEPQDTVSITMPLVYPQKLIKALCVLFMSRTQLASAHLAYVERPGSESHPLLGLVAEGDIRKLAAEIFEVARNVVPGTVIDIMMIDPEGQLDPIRKHLLGIAPFYRRAVPALN
jgi:hypothetical protein